MTRSITFDGLCLAEDEPVSIEDIYIPCKLLSDLDSVDLNVFSLFDIYKFNGIQVTKAWQTLSVTNLDAKDARILQIKPETKVLLFECISRDENGKVIEFSRSFTRSDKASFTVHYNREKSDLLKKRHNDLNFDFNNLRTLRSDIRTIFISP